MYYEEQADPTFWQYYVLLFIVSMIVLCLLLNSMSQLIERITYDIRTISSGSVWLAVIPFFGSFWIFYAVYQLSIMLREEFDRRKIVEFETSPGLSSGIGFCFTFFVAQLSLMFDSLLLSGLMHVAAVVLLIVYWNKLGSFRRKIDHSFTQSTHVQHSPAEQNYAVQHFPPPMDIVQNPYEQPTWQFPPPQQDPPQSPPPDEWERWKPK